METGAKEQVEEKVGAEAAQRAAGKAAEKTTGAENGSHRIGSMVFVILMMLVLVAPFACMTFARTSTTTENRTLAQWPAFSTDDGSFNFDYLKQAGMYFEDHFAFKNELVSAHSQLYGSLFGMSGSTQVIEGTDGWLYYAGTLSDYLRRTTMGERALDNVAWNLHLMQSRVKAADADFVFAIAPDKCSLYPEHMPYYLQQVDGKSNAELLVPYLEKYGVAYVDLFDPLLDSGEVLYYERDTHWNEKGAAIAYGCLLDALGVSHPSYADASYTTTFDYLGDINKMIHPVDAVPEADLHYELDCDYRMEGGASSVEDSWIETTGGASGSDTLLMFRDSFGNALLPFMASTFSHAYFCKLTPYDLGKLKTCKPTCVIIERAERNLASIGRSAAIMEGPSVDLGSTDIPNEDSDTTIQVGKDGSYTAISGVLDGALCDTDVQIYLRITTRSDPSGTVYLPFHITEVDDDDITVSDYGYELLLRAKSIPQEDYGIDVIVSQGDGDDLRVVKSMTEHVTSAEETSAQSGESSPSA